MVDFTIMEQLYYNVEHPASYGGADRLAIAAQRTIGTTKEKTGYEPSVLIHFISLCESVIAQDLTNPAR